MTLQNCCSFCAFAYQIYKDNFNDLLEKKEHAIIESKVENIIQINTHFVMSDFPIQELLIISKKSTDFLKYVQSIFNENREDDFVYTLLLSAEMQDNLINNMVQNVIKYNRRLANIRNLYYIVDCREYLIERHVIADLQNSMKDLISLIEEFQKLDFENVIEKVTQDFSKLDDDTFPPYQEYISILSS